MACYHPVRVQISRKSALAGGARIQFPQTVGCGSCLGCRAEQARQWATRIMHEVQVQDFAWFVTLTYSDECLPEYGSLRATDLRRFFKAVRREARSGSVRYFACGEYGERTERPHYHAVLFGVAFLDRSVLRDTGTGRVWRSSSLERYWKHGLSEFGTVTPASAAYVAGYVRKKVSRRVFPEAYQRVDPETGELVEVESEFSRMSLKPAIGKRWIERFWRDVYPRDMVVVDGKEFKPPRYYDKWMDEHHPEVMLEVREKRYLEVRDLDAEKLAAKEVIHKKRVSLFQQRSSV